jgi:hypothetical protein
VVPDTIGRSVPEVKLEQTRPNVFTLTATSKELSGLVGAARMALEIMATDPDAPPEMVELVGRVLSDYDRAIAGLKTTDGR